jgi:hypothetical protein
MVPSDQKSCFFLCERAVRHLFIYHTAFLENRERLPIGVRDPESGDCDWTVTAVHTIRFFPFLPSLYPIDCIGPPVVIPVHPLVPV